jgi:hypothetical protein
MDEIIESLQAGNKLQYRVFAGQCNSSIAGEQTDTVSCGAAREKLESLLFSIPSF